MKKHPILLNLLIMAGVALVLVILAMLALNIWTDHGKVQIVPDVRGLSVSEAQRVLNGVNLKAEVVDSVYDNAASRGSIVEQVPPAANRVKPGRTVLLTINAYSQRQVTLPELVGTSVRQARATLESLGFKDIREQRVPSDYRDLVLAVKSMGVTMRAGTKLPLSSTLVLGVGEGYVADSDSIIALEEDEWSFD
ncbi:MAG: PASTA domain-containing protein [Bacteroides sp.]|nr:PASTA domain-containing protein [Bacteroides sp.]MCM1378836.1 PASTA domain-containing protein [Bacteroides sp.]MCM1445453.1 PASTA domain-containing protein [Prevotella sp.]